MNEISVAKEKIFIRDLALRCIIGINAEERLEKQEIIINIAMSVDLSKACKTDHIEDTVNYKTIKKSIIKMVEHSSFFLIERLADEIAAICLESPNVLEVQATVDKPGALRFSRSVAVEVTRKR